MADNTLGAHGVASSWDSARPAFFVGGVLNAVAPHIAQHVIKIRSAHRNFGARQLRSHFGRNPAQLRIEPQAGSCDAGISVGRSATRNRRPICTACESRSPGWRPPPHPAAGHRSPFRERGQRGTGAGSTRFALTRPAESSTCSTVSRASGASVIVRPSPRPVEAPRTAQLAVPGRGRRHLRKPA
jgi:hypothetical protein